MIIFFLFCIRPTLLDTPNISCMGFCSFEDKHFAAIENTGDISSPLFLEKLHSFELFLDLFSANIWSLICFDVGICLQADSLLYFY